MPRISKKSKLLGLGYLLLVSLFFDLNAPLSRADGNELSADSIEVRAVRHSSSGNTFLFQSTTPPLGIRSEQVVHVRKGSKKIMAGRVLKKQGNFVYLKRVQGNEGEGAIQDGELYTLVFGVRRPEAVPGSSLGRDSYSVNQEVEGFKFLLEPSAGFAFSPARSSENAVTSRSPYTGFEGGLRFGGGKTHYYAGFDFRYGSFSSGSELGRISSMRLGIMAGGIVGEVVRMSLGFDFINRATLGDSGIKGSGATLGLGYLLSKNVALDLNVYFGAYTDYIISGQSISLADYSQFLASYGYSGFPDRLGYTEYKLTLNFPFML